MAATIGDVLKDLQGRKVLVVEMHRDSQGDKYVLSREDRKPGEHRYIWRSARIVNCYTPWVES
jgi:hypothetical protein